MLDHLHIQNYRLFKDLKIDKLGQVNLIAGKNNTGKTALLEAIRIIRSIEPNSIISNILLLRGDYLVNDYACIKTLFKSNEYKTLQIQSSYSQNDKTIEPTIEKIVIEDITNPKFRPIFRYKLYDSNDRIKLPEPYAEESIVSMVELVSPTSPNDFVVYLPMNMDIEIIQKLWEKISLTPNEKLIIDILKIIEPSIINARVENNKIKLLLEGNSSPIPIGRMGDGVKRLFIIAVGLVNSRNNILLIDEFEVGLHHSVQKQLWEIIFKYAKEWNIQVFVTTHSQDTIENFYYVANRPEFEGMGNYFILSRKDDDVVAIDYDMDEMKLALESNIELR